MRSTNRTTIRSVFVLLVGFVVQAPPCGAQLGGGTTITVNSVAPGFIESAMTEDVFDKDAIKRLVPVGRAGKPDEVADLVAFIASAKAAYISGQIISINGAMI